MTDKKSLTSPCGLDCFHCEIHENNLTEEFAKMLHEKLGVPKQEVACKGCRQQDGNHFHIGKEGCATLNCVKEKEVDFCFNCEDFPCEYLAPVADGASKYPHNMKIYNLCRMKKVGIDQWIAEAGEIRRKYFTHKFIVGLGQAERD